MEHRCHLWSLQERIDLAHQNSYCFTEAHRRCPWLSVPPAGHRAADRHLPKGKIAASGGVATLLVGAVAFVTTMGMPNLGGFTMGAPEPSVRASVAAATASGPSASSQGRVAAARNSAVLQPYGALSPSLLADDRPATISTPLDSAAGSTVVAGNVGLSFSPKSLSEAGDGATVHVEAQPKANVPGGPAQFSPSGSIVDISVRDKAGKLVTTFPDPVQILFKYNASDLAMANGDASELRAAYVIDQDSPELENPNHFPLNTWVFFPPNHMSLDTSSGTISVQTQAIGSIFSVVAVGVGWAQTVRPDVQLYSSFDPAKSTVFGMKKQGSYLRMVEPQIGSRLLVLDVDAGNYAYVNAKDLKPSGPPPAHSTN
ncbi:MAG TPA: hypothetical protein VK009_05340 [Chloroflexota bacterium]|nr:hypothetical protein [Chloroflexota bacterium]